MLGSPINTFKRRSFLRYQKGTGVVYVGAALVIGAWLQPNEAIGASRSEVMFSRYLRYTTCMQRALGQQWWQRYEVATALNVWGVSEPTDQAMRRAAALVQKHDASCRFENELSNEVRPQGR